MIHQESIRNPDERLKIRGETVFGILFSLDDFQRESSHPRVSNVKQNVSLDQLEPSFQNAAMKHCPQCSTEYDDGVNFCFKDGRSLASNTNLKTRLCPYCANSVDEAATSCPYCKGELQPESVPQWLKRDGTGSETSVSEIKRRTIPEKFIWLAAILIVAVAAFSAGGYMQRN